MVPVTRAFVFGYASLSLPSQAMPRIILPLAALLAAIPATAQQQAAPAAQAPPEIPFRILRQTQFDLGDHKLILNRVAPPVLPTAPLKAPPEAAELGPAQVVETAKADKPHEAMFLSATVHDHKFSEIRWMDGTHRWSALSNMDFNLLEALGNIETTDTEYTLLMAIGNEGNQSAGAGESPERDAAGDQAEKAAVNAKHFPLLEKRSTTRAQYVVVEEEPGATPSAKDLALLDALHLYYDANRQRLADEHAKRVTANAERAQWLKEHPPVKKDTVINYWIGEGTTRIPDKQSMGGRP